jgi:hypothetical protein
MPDEYTSIFNRTIEIISPDRDDCRSDGTKTCLCCERPRPTWAMDEDGCGICEECLSP